MIYMGVLIVFFVVFLVCLSFVSMSSFNYSGGVFWSVCVRARTWARPLFI